MAIERRVPLIVVASARAGTADALAADLRRQGAIAYATHSAQGCLRVATSVAPDYVLLDPALPARVGRLLRAHPTSARARQLPLAAAASLFAPQVAPPARSTAGRRAPARRVNRVA